MKYAMRKSKRVLVISMVLILILGLVTFSAPEVEASSDNFTAPGFPHVKRVSDTSLQISWNKVNGAAGYEVYRYHRTTKKYAKVQSINGSTPVKWLDKRLKKNTKYSYKVRAYRNGSSGREYSDFTYAVSALTYKKNAAVVNAGTKFKGGDSMTIGLGQKLKLSAAVTPSLLSKAKKKKVVDTKVRVLVMEQTFVQKADSRTIIGKQVGVTNIYALAHNVNVKKTPVNVVDYAKPKAWENLDHLYTGAAILLTEQYDDFTDVVSWLYQHNEIEGELKLNRDGQLSNASNIELNGIEETIMRVLKNFEPNHMAIWVGENGIYIDIWCGVQYTIVFSIQESFDESEFSKSVYHGLKLADHWALTLFAGA